MAAREADGSTDATLRSRSLLSAPRTQAYSPHAPVRAASNRSRKRCPSYAPLGRVLFWELFLCAVIGRAGSALLPRTGGDREISRRGGPC